jgi:glycosyltransferase involved in cell wall biosynthesis
MLNHSDINGGAARAAYRIHHALRQQGVDSMMHVNQTSAGDWTVQGPPGKWGRTWANMRGPLGGLVTRLLKTSNSVIHSPAILPSAWPKRLNNSDADVIHLHWVNSEMLSIGDIGRLRKPVVWTLHDMWAFCGAEHYTEDFRWRDAYTRHNRPQYESGLDLSRWVWKRKCKHWKRHMHIVTPSKWLADCVRGSALMHNWPVYVVPNAIDTDTWQPVDKASARQILHLPPDVPLLLFGAMSGTNDPRKGFDLLRKALQSLNGQIHGLELVILGQLVPRQSENFGFPVHYTGHVHDDVSLRLLYSATDALVIPSRQDNLPNTGVEALSCGTPIVAFDTCGLPDIVQHKQTGYLAKAFDTDDLANGIRWVLLTQTESSKLGNLSWLSNNSRQDAVTRFSCPVVAEQYLRVYRMAVNESSA